DLRAGAGLERHRAHRADEFATARPADEALADIGLIHQSDHGALAIIEADQRSPERYAGNEASRPVDRVDHPGERARARFLPMLLAEDAVFGIALAYELADRFLAVPVRRRHGVEGETSALVV